MVSNMVTTWSVTKLGRAHCRNWPRHGFDRDVATGPLGAIELSRLIAAGSEIRIPNDEPAEPTVPTAL